MQLTASRKFWIVALLLALGLLLAGYPDGYSGNSVKGSDDRLAGGEDAVGKADARSCPEGQPTSGGMCVDRRQPPSAMPGPAISSARRDVIYPDMMRLPGGTFMMGSENTDDDSEGSEWPRHSVTVGPFAIGKYEVTRDQFAAFVNATGYNTGSSCATFADGKIDTRDGVDWRNPAYPDSGTHPVVCVNLEDVGAYITWLRGRTGRRFRVPTEAEWEYAARAGTDTAQYWGDDPDRVCEYENVADQSGLNDYPGSIDTLFPCADGAAQAASVGSYQANPFGLFDMLGNVWEWTCSAFTKNYNETYKIYDANGGDSLGYESFCTHDISANRAVRSASWLNDKPNVRSALRIPMVNSMRTNFMGFRLAED
jgi:sulfatase modifying factor 1